MKRLLTLLVAVLLAGTSTLLQAQTPGRKEADSLIKVARRLQKQHQYNGAAKLYQKAKQVWPNCKDCDHWSELCKDAARKELEVAHLKNEQEKISRNLRQVTTENEQLDFAQRTKEQKLHALQGEIEETKKQMSEKESLISQARDSLDKMNEDKKATQQEKDKLKEYVALLSKDAKNKDRMITALEEQRNKAEQEKEAIVTEKSKLNETINALRATVDSLQRGIKSSEEAQKKKLLAAISYGKFDYFSLRLSYALIKDAFNNPAANGYGNNFTYTKGLKPQFKAGLELGGVTHVARLGTPMLKLGINFNFTMQAFGKGSASDSGINSYYKVTADELFIGTLGVGPQATFKPFDFMRIAVYGRIGINAMYGNYRNTEYVGGSNTGAMKYDMNIQTRNLALAEDLGIDVTLKKFSIGMLFSFMKTNPGQGQYYTPNGTNGNTVVNYTGGSKPQVSDYDQKISYNRISILLGLAL